jgi:hypothetical protein
MENKMRKIVSTSILSVGALAGLLGALLVSAEPVEAKPAACLQKYRMCDRRCAGSNNADGWVNCHFRTCSPQYERCMGNRLVADKPKNPGTTTKGPQSQRVTGPFVPKFPRKPPTGGFVPSDRSPAGGIVPSGHGQRFGGQRMGRR